MKSKVEPMLSTLIEICNGLSCYNVLSLIRANSDIFYAVFCPSKVFTWMYEMFQQLIKQIFSKNGSNKRNAEVSVYKYFIDLVEYIFMDVEIQLFWLITYEMFVTQHKDELYNSC